MIFERFGTTDQIERYLLLIATAFVFVNSLALAIVRDATRAGSVWLHFGVWAACCFLGHYGLSRRLPRRDPLLFPMVMCLSGWGLVLIDRLAPNFANRQMVWLVVSLFALLISAQTVGILRWLRAYRYTLLFVGLGLLFSTIVLGQNPSGQLGAPELWLGFGQVFFQPSEALKIILVSFLASYLGEQYPALRAEGLDHAPGKWSFSPRLIGPMLLMWTLCVVILVWQEDLGTAILFFVVFLILTYVASGYTPLLFGGALLVALAAVVAYGAFAVVRLRIDIWVNPWPESADRAYQIVQSLLAFASGGIFGQGVAQGQPVFIPVVHSDFVFAAIAEEWGFLGVVATLAILLLIVVRGLRLSVLQRGQPFHTLMAVGLSSVLAVQSLLIMGGVLKIVPLTGVTLPFLSYGGSSLLTCFIMIGLLLRLSAAEGS